MIIRSKECDERSRADDTAAAAPRIQHCSVHAGVNVCEICDGEAHYSCNLPQIPSSKGLPCMELFRCGHGCCRECYEKIAARGFRCPWCRGGRTYVASFEHSDLPSYSLASTQRRSIDTLTEFVDEWKNYLGVLASKKRQHRFIELHTHIVQQEALRRRRNRAC